ncbi:MAG: S-layer homology domain-containing protein [Clostridia bacterium]|nr:S-layer homology domain-containing protein [Clostridia bacterium]
MKKLFLITLSFIFVFSAVMSASAQGDERYITSVQRMESFGIMKGTPDGGLETEREITRSEFATVLIRVSSLESVAEAMRTEKLFTDITEDYWATPYVNFACGLGLMIGVGQNKFDPDSYVTYEQVVKSLICALGYGAVIKPAEDDSTWYTPYMEQAVRLGLLKDVNSDFSIGKPLKRGQVALLLDNALDIDIMEQQGESYVVSKGTTLLDGIYDGGKHTGVVEATHESSLYGDEILSENEVIIDGLRYKTGNTDVADYLGYRVDFYGNDDDGDGVLGSVALSRKNETMKLSGRDVESSTATELKYLDENDRKKSVKLSDTFRVVCNKKAYNGYDKEIFSWPNADFILIDNDADGYYDVAKLTLSEVHQVDHVNVYNNKIYLKDSLTTGSNVIDLDEEAETEYTLKNYRGETISISDIDEEAFLEVYVSPDEKNFDIIKLDQKVRGEISSIYKNSEYIVIGSSEYRVYSTKTGLFTDISQVRVGSYCEAVINTEGEVVDVDTDVKQGNLKYGYLYRVGMDENEEDPVFVRIITGTTTEQTKEKDKYYIIGKDSQTMDLFQLSGKVSIDGASYKSTQEQYSHLRAGAVVKYSLDSDGKINRIDISKPMGELGNRNFNAEDRVFGGITRGAFGMDGKTMVFFLPAGTNEDDIQSAMKYSSGEYACQGFDETDDGNVAGAIVFQTDIDSDKQVYFNDNVSFCVVQEATMQRNEEGDMYVKVSGYEDGKEFQYQTAMDAPAYNMLVNAQCGDIFRFSKNFRGEIITAEQIHTGYDAKNPEHLTPGYPYYERSGTGNKQVFGIVTETQYKALSDYSTEYENILHLSVSEDGSNSEKYSLIFKDSDAPYYYIYDYERGKIMPAGFKDIVASGSSSLDSASEVFLYSLNGIVKLVIIVL